MPGIAVDDNKRMSLRADFVATLLMLTPTTGGIAANRVRCAACPAIAPTAEI